MGAARAPYMAKTDKERLATGFWNRIESNQATDCNMKSSRNRAQLKFQLTTLMLDELQTLQSLLSGCPSCGKIDARRA